MANPQTSLTSFRHVKKVCVFCFVLHGIVAFFVSYPPLDLVENYSKPGIFFKKSLIILFFYIEKETLINSSTVWLSACVIVFKRCSCLHLFINYFDSKSQNLLIFVLQSTHPQGSVVVEASSLIEDPSQARQCIWRGRIVYDGGGGLRGRFNCSLICRKLVNS